MRLYRTIKRFIRRRAFWAALLFLVLACSGLLVLAQASRNRGALVANPIVRAFLPLYRTARELVDDVVDATYLFSMSRDVGIPRYRLEINQSDLGKLNSMIPDSLSDEVIHERFLFGNLKEDVPGKFFVDGQEYEVKVRYRGKSANHWVWPKKSWQLTFDKDTPLGGIRTLKLIIPDDRGYFAEALNNYRAQKLGLAYPRFEFVSLYVNGNYHGVYFAVEDFSKILLERNNKPSDANMYALFLNEIPVVNGIPLTGYDRTDFWRKESTDAQFPFDNFGELGFLLERMRRDDFAETVGDIVDIDSFIAWNTLSLLAGSNHQSDIGNMVLYFNNAKGKFEFIPWDVGVKNALPSELTNRLTEKILENPKYRLERNQRLWEYVKNEANLADDLHYYDRLYQELKGAFYSDFKKHDNNRTFRRVVFETRSQYEALFRRLRDLFETDHVSLSVRHDGSERKLILSFTLESIAGLTLEKIEFPEGVRVISFKPRYLFNREETVTVRYSGNPIIDISKVRVRLVNTVTGKPVAPEAVQYTDLSTFSTFDEIQRTPQEFVAAHPTFGLEEDALVLPAGSYAFSEDVIVPKGTMFRIEPGVTLYLAPKASLVSYSPVEVRGTAALPIRLRPQYPGTPWGSFAILNAGEKRSIIEHLDAEGGGDDYVNGTYLSGMVSIYYSDADIRAVAVSRSFSDDGLNLKYADATVTGSVFQSNSADGLDADYSSGVIRNSVFTNNGNDGIDLSGSEILVQNNRITGSKDKCISIGENTPEMAVLFNNLLIGCHIGVQVKDGSQPVIINSVIADNDIGLDAYLKKPLYKTGGHAAVYNSVIRGNKRQIQHDESSGFSISFSNVEGGQKGEGNFDAGGDVTFVRDVGRGSMQALREHLKIETSHAPVGLFEAI